MPQRISDVFDIDPVLLRENNVFNGFINIDSKFYIDPRLLSKTSAKALVNSREKVINYFDDILADILNLIESSDYSHVNKIVEKLLFSEIPLAGLGYSINTNEGKGIGDKLAYNLLKTVIEIVKLGTIDPAIFELSGIFESGIGADRISDMIVHILLSDIAQFSAQVAEKLKFESVCTSINGSYFRDLPCYKNQGILLVPEDILTSLPIADSLKGRESIARHNKELRLYVNRMIGQHWGNSPTWKDVFGQKKAKLRTMILGNKDFSRDLIERYKKSSVRAYDFQKDPQREFRWHEEARYFMSNIPFNIKSIEDESQQTIATSIANYFKKLMQGRLRIQMYSRSGKVDEKRGQLILLEVVEQCIKGSSFLVLGQCNKNH